MTAPTFYLANAALVVLALMAGAWLQVVRDRKENIMLAKNFWHCLKRWWAYRPCIVRCAFCSRRMWENGKDGPIYCSPDCAHYDGVPQEAEELPF